MKYLFTLLLPYIFCQFSYGQKPVMGIDLGYQVGKEQFFEAGLNLALMIKKPIVTELSVGIEDNINSKTIGYKVGLMAYDGLGISTESPDAKPIPILAGISVISYKVYDNSLLALRPEIGVRGIWRHGQGYTIAKVSYSYNFINVDDNYYQINKHLIRVSFNTYWRSFFDVFRYML